MGWKWNIQIWNWRWKDTSKNVFSYKKSPKNYTFLWKLLKQSTHRKIVHLSHFVVTLDLHLRHRPLALSTVRIIRWPMPSSRWFWLSVLRYERLAFLWLAALVRIAMTICRRKSTCVSLPPLLRWSRHAFWVLASRSQVYKLHHHFFPPMATRQCDMLVHSICSSHAFIVASYDMWPEDFDWFLLCSGIPPHLRCRMGS